MIINSIISGSAISNSSGFAIPKQSVVENGTYFSSDRYQGKFPVSTLNTTDGLSRRAKPIHLAARWLSWVCYLPDKHEVVYLLSLFQNTNISPAIPKHTPTNAKGKSLKLCKIVLFIVLSAQQSKIPKSTSVIPFNCFSIKIASANPDFAIYKTESFGFL